MIGIMRLAKKAILLIIVISIITGVRHMYSPLPAGTSFEGEVHRVPSSSVAFFADHTYVDEKGARHSQQRIFDEVIRMIAGARRYILLDMFLYNPFQGSSPELTRALSEELTVALLQKKKDIPDITIVLITDPLNEVYGGDNSEQFERLRSAGITVVTTDLTALRDSNPLYSGFWRTVVKWFGNSPSAGTMPHPFQAGGEKVSLRSWLALLNFKANHRKLIIADEVTARGHKLATLITSANPHDGSSAHGNIAIKVSDALHADALMTESAVGTLSGTVVPMPPRDFVPKDESGPVEVSLLTEGAIKRRLTSSIAAAAANDTIDIAMFYLSDRDIVNALVSAVFRQVKVRLVLDPNKDAFGHKKNGVPNRPVAAEMIGRNDTVSIRWCDTHGEQCHAKLVLIHTKSGYEMFGGSANLTRRNIGDYNLETNVVVRSAEKIRAIADAYDYFETIWGNQGGKIYTADYDAYRDEAFHKKAMYRLMEMTGMSSF